MRFLFLIGDTAPRQCTGGPGHIRPRPRHPQPWHGSQFSIYISVRLHLPAASAAETGKGIESAEDTENALGLKGVGWQCQRGR